MRTLIPALLLPATLAAQDPGQIALLPGRTGVDPEPGSLLATPARLTVSGLPLADALSRLAERSHVQIAFSPTLLPGDHRVECDCASVNTARALDQLLAGTGLGYAELGTQIVVVPLAAAEPPPLNGTIRGRIRTEVAFPVEDATTHLFAAADSTAHRVTMTDGLGGSRCSGPSTIASRFSPCRRCWPGSGSTRPAWRDWASPGFWPWLRFDALDDLGRERRIDYIGNLNRMFGP